MDPFESKYKSTCEEFEKRGCKLLNTLNEFKQIKNNMINPKYYYVASCGHEHKVFYNVFLNRGTGIKCPKCICKINSISQKEKNDMNKTKDGQSYQHAIDDESIDYLVNILSKNFIVKRTFDGCLADLACKPINVKDDKWIMIQIKTTLKPNKNYAFKCNSSHENCLIFCICREDKRIWLIDGRSISTKDKIAIGLKKSKYDKFEVTEQIIENKILEYFTILPQYTFDIINIPKSKNRIYEQDFCKYRETILPFIDFKYPTRQNIVYDFKINNKTIQEKIGHFSRKTNLMFGIFKRNGKHKKQAYFKGDNDFYWLNSPDKISFWFLPEKILIDNRLISTDLEPNLKITLTVSKNKWLEQYHFKYNDFDKEKFFKIFNGKDI